MGIGTKLQNAIDKRKTNVNEVAKRANVNPSVLYSIIRRNSKSVDINVLITVANILGVPTEYFSDNYKDEIIEEKLLFDTEKALLSDFRKLNEIGQGKAFDYIHDLTEQAKYRLDADKEKTVPESA